MRHFGVVERVSFSGHFCFRICRLFPVLGLFGVGGIDEKWLPVVV